ncbi:hypothetical protein Nepgr_005859 [Nepenthes gracilis]|uniref:RING-type E3 ubiquitin transferase n=1 Tax=Nepenthes gracilis TaxID=150966 RepID=A0AAD3XGU9_NEPGR|nr:hypothetical protein Nepgr_005859 [Nepenthes gracilis]
MRPFDPSGFSLFFRRSTISGYCSFRFSLGLFYLFLRETKPTQMQGQRSVVGSLPDSINFDYGSTSSNVGMDQHICWNNLQDPADNRLTDFRLSASGTDTYMSTLTQEGRNLNRWSTGEPSSSNPQILMNHDERIVQNVCPSSVIASASSGPRLEAQRYEPNSIVSGNNVNLTLNSNQIVNGTSFAECCDSGSNENYDLNVGLLGQVGGDLMECSNLSKSGQLENKMIPSASSSSFPYASSSGSGGFLVEDDDGRPGCSLDVRRLSCKRKSFEGNLGQPSSTSENCFTVTENSIWPAVPPCFDVGSSMNASARSECSLGGQVNPRLGLGMGGVPSAPNVAVGAESSQRNYRMRMNPASQQDSIPNNSFLHRANYGHYDLPPVHEPLRLIPVNPPLDLMSPVLPDNATQRQSVVFRVPSLQRHMQALSWNGASSSRPGRSSAADVTGERDANLNEDLSLRTMPRNISEHPVFTPAPEVRSSVQNPTNWSLNAGNISMPRHGASSSHTGPNSGSHSSSGPNTVSHRHPQSQYSQRLSEYIRRSLMASVSSEIGAQGSNISAHRSIPASVQEVVLPSGSGNQGHSHPYSRSGFLSERQNEGVIGVPYSFRTLTSAGEGRSRLVSEIRNVLDIMRRSEGLRFEDVMILDQTVLFGMADIHDQHRDMRLDVDNMSYEELLALEERIGNVCTGLSEETVLSRMKQHKYISAMRDDGVGVEPCCICQEEYDDGEDLGTLDCGHDFHCDCIKQWLAQKNVCPICKTTALAT